MNNIFNPTRFILSLRRLIVEKGVRLIGLILTFLIITMIFMNFKLDPQIYYGIQNTFLVFGLMFGPIIYSWTLANEFNSQSKAISYLLLPNSKFEKWLLNGVFALAFYFITYLILFRFLDMWMIERINSKLSNLQGLSQIASFSSDHVVVSILVGTAISYTILIGSLYFKKNPLILSLFTLFLFIAAIFTINYIIANIYFAEPVFFGNQFPFVMVMVENSNSLSGEYVLNVDSTLKAKAYTILLPFIFLLSAIYYYRISEKQL